MTDFNRWARGIHLGLFVACSLLAVALVRAVGGLDFGPLDEFMGKWSYNVVLLVASLATLARGIVGRRERRAWLLIGASMTIWTLGNVFYTVALWDLSTIPVPSFADLGWIAFYPIAYAGLISLMRSRIDSLRLSVWLDGVIGALAVAGVSAALVFETILEVTGGPPMSIAINLSYPIGDLMMIALIVGLAGLNGWRPGRSLTFLLVGFLTFGIADSMYLVGVAKETWVAGNPFEAGWPLAMIVVGFAAWSRERARQPLRLVESRLLAVPTIWALTSVSILVYDHFARLNLVALAFGATSLVLIAVRTGMAFVDNARRLEVSQREVLTDELTGLGNRRKLFIDLERVVTAEEHPPATLILFDLNGFKNYNDTFGHVAGDALLARLGGRLCDALGGVGQAYRLGGDEFCVLVGMSIDDPPVASDVLLEALTEEGKGFSVGSAFGRVDIPSEADTVSDALRLADRRMYAHKARGRSSAGRQSGDVLLRAVRERNPELEAHLHDVAWLGVAVGSHLGLGDEELEQLAEAARLHDVGKVAIPDEILRKEDGLTEVERRFVEQHTIIGERILGAAPALAGVAELVRSTHENYDGTGYPDRLAGEDIPLASRIISVCDAFDAMTTDRSYSLGMTVADALSELRSCAGTQFDPEVVEAFAEAIVGTGLWLTGANPRVSAPHAEGEPAESA